MLLRAGRYETLRPIASGGMATVYLGRALGGGGFERAVAIKVLHPHVAAEPEFVAMFLDEARLAAQIHHPNVVATLDLVEDPLFLVMEYIEGPSLYGLMRACKKHRQPFPISIALRIFLDALAGLHAAHDLVGPGGQPLNLVHRDVSPQNVLVGSDGISRITDFGVARAESRISSTRGGALKGKLGYMSPEQIKAKPVDRRSDVYAAGAVLYEMLTGERLFQADNEAALISNILSGPEHGPRAIATAVPEALDAACLRSLASNASDRYPSAAAFAEAIERAIAQSPGCSIASSRAVATLVKGLELHVLPQASGGGPGRSRDPASTGSAGLTPSPSSFAPISSSMPESSRGVSVSSVVLPASVAARRSLGSLADVLEPQRSTTGLGGVVAEPPPRTLVGRSTLIAVG
ncbi:MAG TPA: serine/threonine-protein kinase, partial [Candidatus Nanopelagicales bacterium]|nr:serine/threonine-protein kinase [Candidatus Nanopelagicales bacterium]